MYVFLYQLETPLWLRPLPIRPQSSHNGIVSPRETRDRPLRPWETGGLWTSKWQIVVRRIFCYFSVVPLLVDAQDWRVAIDVITNTFSVIITTDTPRGDWLGILLPGYHFSNGALPALSEFRGKMFRVTWQNMFNSFLNIHKVLSGLGTS